MNSRSPRLPVRTSVAPHARSVRVSVARSLGTSVAFSVGCFGRLLDRSQSCVAQKRGQNQEANMAHASSDHPTGCKRQLFLQVPAPTADSTRGPTDGKVDGHPA